MTDITYRTTILPGLGPVLVPAGLSDAEIMRDLVAETPSLGSLTVTPEPREEDPAAP